LSYNIFPHPQLLNKLKIPLLIIPSKSLTGQVGFEHISSLIVGPMKSLKNNLYEIPVKAIRKKCIDCCNGQYEEIRNWSYI
tara:strand:- start:68 stop:310 length:243 start_codon:yes stop_codon:yes gene_type:complete